MALGGDVALAHRRLVAADRRAAARGAVGQQVLAAEVVGDPLPLRLGERHDRAERLEQPDEQDVGVVRMEDAPEQLDVVVGRGDEVLVEERERDLVARAVDDDVGLDAAAVGELDLVAVEARDVRLGRDRAVREAVEDAPGDGRVRLAEAVVGLRQAVVLHVADGLLEDQPRSAFCADLERDPRVGRRAGRRGRRRRRTWGDPRAAAGGEVVRSAPW